MNEGKLPQGKTRTLKKSGKKSLRDESKMKKERKNGLPILKVKEPNLSEDTEKNTRGDKRARCKKKVWREQKKGDGEGTVFK